MISSRELFLRHLAPTSEAPLLLEIDYAKGTRLFLKDGRSLIDLIGGISVCPAGHGQPDILQAIHQQAEKYLHVMVYGEMVQSPQTDYAGWLTERLPDSLQSVYFTNSGAEAIEGAMKLAKRVSGRTRFLSFNNGYHGSTQGALSLMGSPFYSQAYRPLLPDCIQLPYNKLASLGHIDERVAAVVIEPVQAESGITPASDDFLQSLREKCSKQGVLLIYDESQSGMGRTGSLFSFQQTEVIPDILVLSKALGGGLPLGAFISSREYMHQLAVNPVLGHITTFGGHPLSCAAGLAAARVVESEKYLADADQKGKLFVERLQHSAIRSIRQKGLMVGVHFDTFEQNKKIIDRCIETGVFTDWFLYAPQALRIVPPLSISVNEIHEACDILLWAIQQVQENQ
jgi:acetylornithine/N-succinyldiaminopimelate aminotransferase